MREARLVVDDLAPPEVELDFYEVIASTKVKLLIPASSKDIALKKLAVTTCDDPGYLDLGLSSAVVLSVERIDEYDDRLGIFEVSWTERHSVVIRAVDELEAEAIFDEEYSDNTDRPETFIEIMDREAKDFVEFEGALGDIQI
jgi:hypothetical protein